MEPFTTLKANALPVARPNVDTDQILPARYLQKPRSAPFGDFLFRDLRFNADGSEKPDFVLNKPFYRDAKIVVAEENFACGSSREHAVWALYDYGVRAVIAASFERIHRSNLVGMGVLPCQLPANTTAATYGLDGTEVFDLVGLDDNAAPRQPLKLVVHRRNGEVVEIPVTLRLDTRMEVDYVRQGGIMPYVLKELIGDAA